MLRDNLSFSVSLLIPCKLKMKVQISWHKCADWSGSSFSAVVMSSHVSLTHYAWLSPFSQKALFNNEVKLMERSGSSYHGHQSFHYWSLLIKMKACMVWGIALVPIILSIKLQMQFHANCFYWSNSQTLKLYGCQNFKILWLTVLVKIYKSR